MLSTLKTRLLHLTTASLTGSSLPVFSITQTHTHIYIYINKYIERRVSAVSSLPVLQEIIASNLTTPHSGGCEGRIHRQKNWQARCWTHEVQGSAEKDERWPLEGRMHHFNTVLNVAMQIYRKHQRWTVVFFNAEHCETEGDESPKAEENVSPTNTWHAHVLTDNHNYYWSCLTEQMHILCPVVLQSGGIRWSIFNVLFELVILWYF